MSVESQILGIKISSISKILGKSKNQIEKLFDQPAPVLGLRTPTLAEQTTYAAPVISISRDSGEYESDTVTNSSIQLTSNKSNTTIYYTLDGSSPTEKSLKYNAAIGIRISDASTLKYIAAAPKTLKTDSVTKTYTITPGLNQLANPVFTSVTNDNGNPIVTMTALSGSYIYYTDDGSTPTTNSRLYTEPILIMATGTTIKAIATKSGYENSNVTSALYTVTVLGTLDAPVIELTGTQNDANEYIETVTAAITDRSSTAGVSIYYTTDDSTPTTSSTLYEGPIQFNATDTIKAKSFASGYNASPIATQAFTIGVPTQVATPAIKISGVNVSGEYTGDKTITFSSTTSGVTFYYTTNGTTPTTSSASGTSFTTAGSATVKVLAVKSNYTNSTVASASYTIKVPTPAFGAATGTYTNDQSVTLTDSLSGATIFYKLGDNPEEDTFNEYTGAFNTLGTATYTAVATKDGYTNSDTVSVTYTIRLTSPTLSIGTGTFYNDFDVTITAGAGTTIRYTLNGTTPDSNSTIYSGPITINGSKTLSAIAQKNGYTDSSKSSGIYTLVVDDPTFSPAHGSTVLLGDLITITTTTTGATIKYTTDGTTPSESVGTTYTGPIAITE